MVANCNGCDDGILLLSLLGDFGSTGRVNARTWWCIPVFSMLRLKYETSRTGIKAVI